MESALQDPSVTADPEPKRSKICGTVRIGFIGTLGLLLFWLVITKSLPTALAPGNPKLAVWLDPSNPVGLLQQAEELSSELINLVGKEQTDGSVRPSDPAAESQEGSRDKGGTGRLEMLRPATDGKQPAGEREAYIRRIRSLAIRVIENDPLNAAAFRLLAEVTDDVETSRNLMLEAMKRSRRESSALFWLLDESFTHEEYAEALSYADILLRTQPDLAPFVSRYLGEIFSDQNGRKSLLAVLAKSPELRRILLTALAQGKADLPIEFMIDLKAAGSPPTTAELKLYLASLIANRSVSEAYQAWVKLSSHNPTEARKLLRNAGFNRKPSGLPFDWRTGRARNAVVEFVPRKGASKNDRSLHIVFSAGRVSNLRVQQTLALPPGHYVFSGKVLGSITGNRGLRWQMHCHREGRVNLGQTDMLLGVFNAWQNFSVEFSVPEGPACDGQILRLLHDARSASEQFISGEAWFDDLQLVPNSMSALGPNVDTTVDY